MNQRQRDFNTHRLIWAGVGVVILIIAILVKECHV